MTASMEDCVFCKIAGGAVGVEFLGETEGAVAFRDIAPLAASHVLVVPKRHVASIAEVADDVILDVMRLARTVADDLGLSQSGYRLVCNTGPHAGQTVFHLHVHVLGGEALGGFGSPGSSH
jgi:histidine triad (HIT) family protein